MKPGDIEAMIIILGLCYLLLFWFSSPIDDRKE